MVSSLLEELQHTELQQMLRSEPPPPAAPHFSAESHRKAYRPAIVPFVHDRDAFERAAVAQGLSLDGNGDQYLPTSKLEF